MRTMIAVCSALILALLAMSPAQAHRLRVFATVEQGEISGYAYFVGGARAKGASVVFRDGGDRELHRTIADAQGGFRWRPEPPQTIKVVVDAGEGHVGSITIDRARFSGRRAAEEEREESEHVAEAGLSSAHRELIESAVDAAMERHARTLLEKFEAMETRTRFNDVVGGIGMILGLAGAAMWAMARRKGGAA